MAARLRTVGVRLLDATPSHLRLLLDAGWPGGADGEPDGGAGGGEDGAAPAAVLVGGEAVEEDLWRSLAAAPSRLAAFNVYGPTECTVDVTAELMRGTVPSLGAPLANVRAYVLDEGLNPVPAGVEGELFIAGERLARGYFRRNDLTAERFLDDPFQPGGRMYRSGDRARWDGTVVHYLGRADDQVKWRGFRIEPGEIEAALAGQPGIVTTGIPSRISWAPTAPVGLGAAEGIPPQDAQDPIAITAPACEPTSLRISTAVRPPIWQ